MSAVFPEIISVLTLHLRASFTNKLVSIIDVCKMEAPQIHQDPSYPELRNLLNYLY
jgi:hypothetical protein